jgi:hypothetical protein
MALIGGAALAPIEEPTLEEKATTKLREDESKQRIVLERYLCRKMAACSKKIGCWWNAPPQEYRDLPTR